MSVREMVVAVAAIAGLVAIVAIGILGNNAADRHKDKRIHACLASSSRQWIDNNCVVGPKS